MSVIRRTPVNRLGKLMRQPGGLPVGEALAAAERNLRTLQNASLGVMDEKLAQIGQAVARCRAQPTPQDIQALYRLGNEVLEIAGVFQMGQLGEAAFSLCDLIDRFRTYKRWSQAALEVHLQGLIALRAAAGVGDEATAAVLDGLRRVVERVSSGEAAA